MIWFSLEPSTSLKFSQLCRPYSSFLGLNSFSPTNLTQVDLTCDFFVQTSLIWGFRLNICGFLRIGLFFFFKWIYQTSVVLGFSAQPCPKFVYLFIIIPNIIIIWVWFLCYVIFTIILFNIVIILSILFYFCFSLEWKTLLMPLEEDFDRHTQTMEKCPIWLYSHEIYTIAESSQDSL